MEGDKQYKPLIPLHGETIAKWTNISIKLYGNFFFLVKSFPVQ